MTPIYPRPKFWLILIAAAFILNIAWENAHHVLYLHYRGQAVSQLILLRAAAVDAAMIAAIAAAARCLPNRWQLPGLAVFAIAVAVGLERWALATARWAYADAMPVIPLINTGLTPTIQLALTALAAVLIAEHITQSFSRKNPARK